ncbi:MAG: hypothetical protein LBG78_09825 [Azoarcus sp.]|jgi:hypothetical protein|nr:hypothetical protein [Azoarcus sp.]
MLSMRDCLDYCDLTDEEVSLIAEFEGIPDVMAGQVLCGLVQTDEGVQLLARWLQELIDYADAAGLPDKAARARAEFSRFSLAHQLAN